MQSLLESSLYHSLLTGNPLSLFYLSIISIRPVFPVVMFILQFLRCRFYLRIDQFTAACHLRHFLKHNCIVNCLMCIFAPCKRSMILAKYCRNSFIIKVFEIICDQHTRILFVCFLNLLFCQITYTWNFSVNIVRMSRTIAWNRSSCLCPARRPFGECVCTIPPIFGNAL